MPAVTFHEFLDLLIRWVHLIAGIMWIGNSMLFNWLDRNLEKAAGRENEVGYEGKMWMVHSGGFYEVEKRQLSPGQMPATLHWFKWQNFTAWASGIALLVVVYYMNGGAYLIDPQVRALGLPQAIAFSVLSLVLPFTVYHLMWRTIGKAAPTLAGLVSVATLLGVTYALTQMFSGRAAYLHVGVLLGTVMTGNVWMVIVPSQRKLVAATESGQEQDYALNQRAKQRSIHNNYLTFPLLFIMLSNHFPSATGHPLNWLVLIAVMVGGAGVRHYMNIRYLGGGKELATGAWLAPAIACGAFAVAGLLVITRIQIHSGPQVKGTVTFARAQEILVQRCMTCHSQQPTDDVFKVAPNGIVFDSPENVVQLKDRIYDRAVRQRTMPLVNKTQMSDMERAELGAWISQGAKLQ